HMPMGHCPIPICHIEPVFHMTYGNWEMAHWHMAPAPTLRKIQLPYEWVRVVFINDFERAVLHVPAVNRNRNQKSRDKEEERNHPLRPCSNPPFEGRHRECVDREAVQVGACQKREMGFHRQV